MSNKSFYWHDYETWGANPAEDWPSQFAGIRTDADLNVIGDPDVFYCQPPIDRLPHPEAALITGITPQQAAAQGLPEHEFFRQIHARLAEPATCAVGYNSIRFDDEVTRYGFYRNFQDPYSREWQNGNSRWDLLDVVRLWAALRPEGINWPTHEDGTPSFKLEHLTAANGLAHEAAHDALSDVEATIALARLLREKQPRLFDYALSLRDKRQVAQLLDVQAQTPVVHVSGMIPAERHCLSLMMPLAQHPVNRNAIIAYDLTVDPDFWLDWSAEQIAERLYTRSEDLPEGQQRVALKEIHLNKSPMVATRKLLNAEVAQRCQVDLAQCERSEQLLRMAPGLDEKLNAVFQKKAFAARTDPDQMLYEGFFADADRRGMQQVAKADEATLASHSFSFEDARLPELLLRYKARNFPASLNEAEEAQWLEHCYERLNEQATPHGLTMESYYERLNALATDASERDQQILMQLAEWAESLGA